MKIGFTGTQIGINLLQKEKLHKLLFRIHSSYNKIEEVHHGDCIGADEQFHDTVRKINFLIKIIIHPPINESKRAFCKGDIILPQKEYIVRNHDIVDVCDILIATPKEVEEVLRSGTWSTVRYAFKNTKQIAIINRKTGNIEDYIYKKLLK